MYLTVAICTWNRCDLLRKGLEQMCKLIIPSDVEWELLVVNNNCTDVTDTVIAEFAAKLPIRRLFEPTPGKSYALNLAVREAKGEYILWTDDDTLLDENWLAAYVKGFQQWPEAVFFGGPVRPWFAVAPPAWLEKVLLLPRLASVYALRDLSPVALRIDGITKLPYGPNWAVRVREQRVYLYDPRLGPRPGSNIRCEETQIMQTMLADGYEGRWIPEASVRHHIPAERMTTRFIRQYMSGYGQYLAMTEPPYNGPRLFGKPRWLWRRIVTTEINYSIHRLTSSPDIWINHLMDASLAWGSLSAHRSS
jgi:hypothetical protein